jgi:hypothetical protein
MSLRLTCTVSGDMSKITGRARDRIAAAATAAMRDAANQLKTKGRAAIAAGGMSTKFQNALRVKVFPEQGDSISPAVIAYSKIPYAGVFEDGATISGSPFLWLPLDNAPFGRGGNRMTPKKFIATIGPLYAISRPGKPPLLGAVIRATDARAAKGVSLSLLRRGRNPNGRGTVRLVPVFIGIRRVTDPKKFDINDVAREVASGIGEAILKKMEQSNG